MLGEQRDDGASEEEKEADNEEWFTDFSCRRNEGEVEIDGYHSEEFKNPVVVMMKLMMLTKFILNIMKVVELVKTSWN